MKKMKSFKTQLNTSEQEKNEKKGGMKNEIKRRKNKKKFPQILITI